MLPSARAEGGFTLLEALVAMTIFAIGSVMMVPAIFAWVQANTLTLQKDEVSRSLGGHAHRLRQADWSAWSTTEEASNFESAAQQSQTCVDDFLDGGTATCATGSLTFDGFMQSEVAPDQSPNGGYAITAVTQSGSTLTRVMVLEVRWQGPAGHTREVSRIVQRPSPNL